jgi:hypothetical protein
MCQTYCRGWDLKYSLIARVAISKSDQIAKFNTSPPYINEDLLNIDQ